MTLALALASAARAAPLPPLLLPVEVVPDSGAKAADTSGVVPRRRTIRRAPAPGVPRRLGFDQPRWVMLRSLVVPGWGQLHNRAYLKAAAVAGAEGTLIVQLFDDTRQLKRLDDAVGAAGRSGNADRYADAVRAYNSRLEGYTSRQWFLAGVLVYSLLDSYVDAHFRDFELEFKNDPALPEGAPKSLQVRVGGRWSF